MQLDLNKKKIHEDVIIRMVHMYTHKRILMVSL